MKLLRSNPHLKVAAIGAALVFWYLASENAVQTRIKDFEAQVQLRSLAPEVVLLSELPSVSVSVSGSIEDVEDVRPSGVSVYADAEGLAAGQHEVKVEVAPSRALKDRQLRFSVTPRTIRLRLDVREEREFSVQCLVRAVAPEGMVIAPPVVEPPSVTVTGNASEVNSVVRAVVTAENAPQGARPGAQIRETLRVQLLNSNGEAVEGLEAAPQNVDVTLTLEESRTDKILLVSPRISGNPPYPYRVVEVTVSPDTVRASGARSVLMRTSVVQTEPVDVSNLRDVVTRDVSLEALPGVLFHTSGPFRVTVKVERPEEEETETPPPAESGEDG